MFNRLVSILDDYIINLYTPEYSGYTTCRLHFQFRLEVKMKLSEFFSGSFHPYKILT